MTRENKLALIIGFSLILVVAILITDHLSPAHNAQLADLAANAQTNLLPVGTLPRGASDQLPRYADGRPVPIADRSTPGEGFQFLPGTEAANADVRESESNKPTVQEPTMPTPAQTITPPAGPGRATGEIVHPVQKGETLYGLAQRYYNDPSLAIQLAAYNHDLVPDNLQIREGVTLRIPSREALLAKAAPILGDAPEGTATPVEKPKAREYTVQKGDTLSEIASKQLGSAKRWRELYQFNKGVIKDPDNVPAGTVLKLPAN